MAVTLTNLTDRAKQEADLVGSNFVTSTEWTTWINSGLQELYDLVVSAYEDYFMIPTDPDLTITTGNTVALPAGFYKLRGVDYKIAENDYIDLDQFNFKDRNRQMRWQYSRADKGTERKYRMIGDNLEITPYDKAPGTYKIWYVPMVTPLASGSDTIPLTLSKFGWEEYIVLYTAIKAQIKAEADPADFINQKDALSARIISMAPNRNADQPERVTDLTGILLNRWDGIDW